MNEAGPRRVLLTADTASGVWCYALELARGLARRGIAVHLATMGERPSPEQRAEVEAVQGLTLHESSYRVEWMPDSWDDVARAGSWLLELDEKLAADVIHLNHFCHAALPYRAPRLVAGHSCAFSSWRALSSEMAPPALSRY